MPKLRFGLTSVFYAIALLASALAAFGTFGMLACVIVGAIWIILFMAAASRISRREAVVVLAIILFLIALMLPAGQHSSSRSLPYSCYSHLREIQYALLQYHAEHSSFPPAYVVDANGRPMHSWRVIILPYIRRYSGKSALIQKYDFNEPWDGPNNSKLIDEVPPVYQCPSSAGGESLCSYVAITGPGTVWRGAKPVTIDEITDGAGNTIMLTETPNPVPWTKPEDISADEFLELFADEGRRPTLAHRDDTSFTDYGSFLYAITADKHLRTISERTRADAIGSTLTIAGGDEVDWTSLARESTARLKWGNIISLTVSITMFLLLAVLPAVRLFSPAQKRHDIRVDKV